jgi:hypothetical protein
MAAVQHVGEAIGTACDGPDRTKQAGHEASQRLSADVHNGNPNGSLTKGGSDLHAAQQTLIEHFGAMSIGGAACDHKTESSSGSSNAAKSNGDSKAPAKPEIAAPDSPHKPATTPGEHPSTDPQQPHNPPASRTQGHKG